MTYEPTLRARLRAKYGIAEQPPVIHAIPSEDLIEGELSDRLDSLARAARFGDVSARDELYFTFLPRLRKLSWVVRPYPNSNWMTSVWERSDVAQESWLVYYELLAMWDEHIPFASYLLANFAFRLKDRILRGVGKPSAPHGVAALPITEVEDASGVAITNAEESVVIALMSPGTGGSESGDWCNTEDIGVWRGA